VILPQVTETVNNIKIHFSEAVFEIQLLMGLLCSLADFGVKNY